MRGTRRAARVSRMLAAAVVIGTLLGGCATTREAGPSGSAASAAAPLAQGSPAPTASPTASATADAAIAATASAERRVDAMTIRERAGTVLMTAAAVPELASLRGTVRKYHLSGVMVRGRSTAGMRSVRATVRRVASAAPRELPLLVATDQEGGTVQVLRGAGFAEIPSAVRQATWPVGSLRRHAASWGGALADAGMNLDLAPVADTPCPATRDDNPPVADLRRNYGAGAEAAGRSVAAVVHGLDTAGVASTLKHFPGLGCVRRNTDTDTHVVDDAIDRTSLRLQPFRAGIAAGARFVMVSSATYTRIDAHRPALFSSAVVEGLLRHDLGFEGVIMSDDVGGAAATKPWSPGTRAVRFVAAGGDLLLDIVPGDVPAMVGALADRAAQDGGFGARLTAAATRVVAAREAVAARR